MSLDKNGLINALKALHNKISDPTWTADQAAEAIADAIDTFVKSGTVTSQSDATYACTAGGVIGKVSNTGSVS